MTHTHITRSSHLHSPQPHVAPVRYTACIPRKLCLRSACSLFRTSRISILQLWCVLYILLYEMLTLKCIVILPQIHRLFSNTKHLKWVWNVSTYTQHTRNGVIWHQLSLYKHKLTDYFIRETIQRVNAVWRGVVKPWTCCAVNKQQGSHEPCCM